VILYDAFGKYESTLPGTKTLGSLKKSNESMTRTVSVNQLASITCIILQLDMSTFWIFGKAAGSSTNNNIVIGVLDLVGASLDISNIANIWEERRAQIPEQDCPKHQLVKSSHYRDG
jgi:uncharacterized protein YjfI (DUF2170 family)